MTEHPKRDRRARWSARALPAGIGARLVLLIALALLPMLLLLAWVYYQRYDSQRAQALQTELEVAQGVATLFDAYVEDVRRQALLTGEAILAFETYTTAKANALLTVVGDQYVAVTDVNWASQQGRILASNNPEAIGADISDRPYFQAILAGREWAVSDLLPEGRISGRPTFIIAHGIRDDAGRLRGVVVAALDPTRLDEVTLTQRRPAAGAYVVFDREGVIVFRNPEVAFTWEERVQWRETDAVLQRVLRTGQPATGIGELDVVGGEWVAARAPIPAIGWVAGAARPTEVALGPLRDALVLDTLLALLATALAVVLAFLIARTIIRPLRGVREDVRRFGEGDLSHRAAEAGPAEVAQLAAGFNQMAGQIEEFQDTLETRVRQRTAELEASNKELESFSYTVAHDLRSPLRALDGYSKYVLEHYQDQLDERGADYLTRIRAAAQRMGRLIDDLLNMARISRMPMQVETVDLSELASDIIGDLRKRDPSRRLEVEIAPGLTARGDRELLRLALAHLLENAWKFTAPREVARIEVGAATRDGRPAYYIRDNGVGFDMAYADKLFLPFHRLHTEDEFPGTGIGLAIVHRIITRHHGHIRAESEEGKGSTFTFTLPLTRE